MKTILFKQGFKTLLVLLTGLLAMSSWGQTETAIYTVSSTSAVSTTGTTPAGSTAVYSQTYNTAKQITSGNSATFTLSGYGGHKITSVVLSMKSNTSKGKGTLTMKAGGTTIVSIEPTKGFNDIAWYGAWSTSYVNVVKTPTLYDIATGENIVITINATENSLYIESYTLVYEPIASAPTYIVTFNANGGTGTMAPQIATAATSLTANSFTRTGYEFGGWNTAADGSGTAYTNGQTYSFSADMTLFAQWKAQITYDANGGSNPPSLHTTDLDGSITIKTKETMTRPTFVFVAWNTSASGIGDTYTPGQEVTFTTPTLLYAQWESCAGTITAIKPSSGAPAGTEITIAIAGNYFISGQTYTVNFNGSAPVSGTAISSTQLQVTVPNGATGGFNLETEQPCDSISAYPIITEDITGCE